MDSSPPPRPRTRPNSSSRAMPPSPIPSSPPPSTPDPSDQLLSTPMEALKQDREAPHHAPNMWQQSKSRGLYPSDILVVVKLIGFTITAVLYIYIFFGEKNWLMRFTIYRYLHYYAIMTAFIAVIPVIIFCKLVGVVAFDHQNTLPWPFGPGGNFNATPGNATATVVYGGPATRGAY